jgi:hypothetical protein
VFILKRKSSLEPAGEFQSNFITNHPWVKGILNCSNKGPGPLQRGDNYKNGLGSFKIFYRTTEPE